MVTVPRPRPVIAVIGLVVVLSGASIATVVEEPRRPPAVSATSSAATACDKLLLLLAGAQSDRPAATPGPPRSDEPTAPSEGPSNDASRDDLARSLIVSGVLGLVVSVAGLVIVGWQRRRW
jgi:hypothetical protein